MRLKTIVDEDFINYKLPSMFIGTVSCSGKCCTEGGFPLSVCQNDEWRDTPIIDMPDDEIVRRYQTNPITSAIVFGGLEPFEQPLEVLALVKCFREAGVTDDVVIYTGYKPYEISPFIELLRFYKNIIIKFGRYVPGQTPHHDEILGVDLVSDNQYAERVG